MTEPVDCRYQEVTCADCKRSYICTPADDYYNSTTLEDGVCTRCLLLAHGMQDADTVTLTPLCVNGEFSPTETETLTVPRSQVIGL